VHVRLALAVLRNDTQSVDRYFRDMPRPSQRSLIASYFGPRSQSICIAFVSCRARTSPISHANPATSLRSPGSDAQRFCGLLPITRATPGRPRVSSSLLPFAPQHLVCCDDASVPPAAAAPIRADFSRCDFALRRERAGRSALFRFMLAWRAPLEAPRLRGEWSAAPCHRVELRFQIDYSALQSKPALSRRAAVLFNVAFADAPAGSSPSCSTSEIAFGGLQRSKDRIGPLQLAGSLLNCVDDIVDLDLGSVPGGGAAASCTRSSPALLASLMIGVVSLKAGVHNCPTVQREASDRPRFGCQGKSRNFCNF